MIVTLLVLIGLTTVVYFLFQRNNLVQPQLDVGVSDPSSAGPGDGRVD